MFRYRIDDNEKDIRHHHQPSVVTSQTNLILFLSHMTSSIHRNRRRRKKESKGAFSSFLGDRKKKEWCRHRVTNPTNVTGIQPSACVVEHHVISIKKKTNYCSLLVTNDFSYWLAHTPPHNLTHIQMRWMDRERDRAAVSPFFLCMCRAADSPLMKK